MIVIEESLLLELLDGSDANAPLIGYDNVILTGAISVTSEAPGFPIINVANPSTYLRWQATSSAAQVIAIDTTNAELIDYVAIARHNLGFQAFNIRILGADTLNGLGQPVYDDELIELTTLVDNAPVIFRFEPRSLLAIAIEITPLTGLVPTIAVLYSGLLLKLQRNIYVGHTPIPYGRMTQVVNAQSETGNFLGRIITGQSTETSVNMQNLTASWYRANMEPFLKVAQERPFFFAWRPGDYPLEVGYAWLTNDPKPSNQRPNGMMQVELQMAGVVE